MACAPGPSQAALPWTLAEARPLSGEEQERLGIAARWIKVTPQGAQTPLFLIGDPRGATSSPIEDGLLGFAFEVEQDEAAFRVEGMRRVLSREPRRENEQPAAYVWSVPGAHRETRHVWVITNVENLELALTRAGAEEARLPPGLLARTLQEDPFCEINSLIGLSSEGAVFRVHPEQDEAHRETLIRLLVTEEDAKEAAVRLEERGPDGLLRLGGFPQPQDSD